MYSQNSLVIQNVEPWIWRCFRSSEWWHPWVRFDQSRFRWLHIYNRQTESQVHVASTPLASINWLAVILPPRNSTNTAPWHVTTDGKITWKFKASVGGSHGLAMFTQLYFPTWQLLKNSVRSRRWQDHFFELVVFCCKRKPSIDHLPNTRSIHHTNHQCDQ